MRSAIRLFFNVLMPHRVAPGLRILVNLWNPQLRDHAKKTFYRPMTTGGFGDVGEVGFEWGFSGDPGVPWRSPGLCGDASRLFGLLDGFLALWSSPGFFSDFVGRSRGGNL